MPTCEDCGAEYDTCGKVEGARVVYKSGDSGHSLVDCWKTIKAERDTLRGKVSEQRLRWDDLLGAVVPAVRLVWEQGGWSGASGNWPLVDAWGKLEGLKTTEPEVFAQITEKLVLPVKTSEPCMLCMGSGKYCGKSLGEVEGDSFKAGKDTQRFIFRAQVAAMRVFVQEIQTEAAVPAAEYVPALGLILERAQAFLATIKDDP